MNRRTTIKKGFINFPMHLPNTNEGGTFVRLGVREKNETQFDDLWMVCSGGYNAFFMDESYIGNDIDGSFEIEDYSDLSWIEKELEFERKIFPMYKMEDSKNDEYHGKMGEYLSNHWLCMMTIGSTGWTGRNEQDKEWICTYNDLTDEGKTLYDSMRNLYGDNCEILLLTFIDT